MNSQYCVHFWKWPLLLMWLVAHRLFYVLVLPNTCTTVRHEWSCCLLCALTNGIVEQRGTNSKINYGNKWKKVSEGTDFVIMRWNELHVTLIVHLRAERFVNWFLQGNNGGSLRHFYSRHEMWNCLNTRKWLWKVDIFSHRDDCYKTAWDENTSCGLLILTIKFQLNWQPFCSLSKWPACSTLQESMLGIFAACSSEQQWLVSL